MVLSCLVNELLIWFNTNLDLGVEMLLLLHKCFRDVRVSKDGTLYCG